MTANVRPPSKRSARTIAYGPHAAQSGDLHLPDDDPAPVVCLLHGGFWRAPHGREQFTAIARDLAAHGFAVWNVGYRRIGDSEGHWPATLADVAAAIDHLAVLADAGEPIDIGRTVVVGHSAGGQLALWASARGPGRGIQWGPNRVKPLAAAALAGITDLAHAHALDLGNSAVATLLGGSPETQADRYRIASPAQMLPLRIPQLILHGIRDDAVPFGMSRHYVACARAAGDRIDCVELEEAGHMDFIDPGSRAHAEMRSWLVRVTMPGQSRDVQEPAPA